MLSIQTGKIKTNQHLTQIAVQYKNLDFNWDRLAPPLMVNKESDKYRVYKKDGWFSGAPIRNDGTLAEEASLSYDDATYNTRQRALKDIVTDRAMKNADSIFNLKADTTRFLTEKIKLSVELDVADLAVATDGTGVSTATPDHLVTPNDLWSDDTNSNPETDITDGKESIMRNTGRKPNKIFISGEVEKYLGRHPLIKELLKYTSKEALTKGGVPARLWDLDVIVMSSVYNSAAQGLEVDMTYTFGKNALIAYVNPSDSLTFMRTFVLRSQNMLVDTWRDEEREGDWLRVKNNYIPKVICPECGYLLSGVIA